MNQKQALFLSLLAGFLASCTTGTETFSEKQISFKPETSDEEKIKQSALVVPTPQQLNWQQLEMTAFVHFTINTYTNLEWGHGDESPEIFNPAQLDARQWVKTLKDAGMKMVILTCKHHDGFCLWPTKTTQHSVASSPWKDGKGDVVHELKAACEEMDMKFGVYLSPWDRNAAVYGDSPAYNEFFRQQLTELLTWHGKVDEVWFDGACGEGPNGKKQEYDGASYYSLIHQLQPEAVTAIMGEDIRWVGTESGYGRETEWSVTPYAPGGRSEMEAINKKLNLDATSSDLGSRELVAKAEHLFWYPAEVDVSIRPGWFYHPSEDNQVKSLEKLVDIYFSSVGRNAVLLLNVPPDTRGLIHETDAARLREFGDYIRKTFQTNLLKSATSTPKKASKTIDEDASTYFTINELPAAVEFTFKSPQQFNLVMLQEAIEKGQRVEKFKVEALVNNQWTEIAKGTTIGYKRLLRFPTVESQQVRFTIEEARLGANIATLGLYNAPELLSTPQIQRNKQGMVSITLDTPHPVITYTTNGSEPNPHSTVYTAPFEFSSGGIVKAKAFINSFSESGSVVTAEYDICPAKWKVVEVSDQAQGYPAENGIDGNINTMWHTQWTGTVKNHPHHLVIDLGETLSLKGFSYTPRNDHNKSGTISRFNLYLSEDGKSFSKVISRGEFSNIANNPIQQKVMFNKVHKARFVKFESLEGAFHEPWLSMAEFGVVTR
jgi:alpha-L-fucosidase